MISITLYTLRRGTKEETIVANEISQLEHDINLVLNNEELPATKINQILELMRISVNDGTINSLEMNELLNEYQSKIIHKGLDAYFIKDDNVSIYDELRVVDSVRLIFTDYFEVKESLFGNSKPITQISYAEEVFVMTINNKTIKLDADRLKYYDVSPHSAKASEGELFDFWLELLSDVIDSYYPELKDGGDAIVNALNIFAEWSSEQYVIKMLYILFGGCQIDDEVYLGTTTILGMVIADDKEVINISKLYEFGNAYTIDEGVEYLNEKVGKTKNIDDDPVDPWLEEMVLNPYPVQYIMIPRGNALSNVQNYIRIALAAEEEQEN